MEDKPRTDLGQAENKKDLRRAATEGKCNFTILSYDVDAENMIQKGEVEIFKKKGRAEIYVPPEEDTSYTPSKGCQFLYLLMA